jgi:biotin transport system substrate-specific component
MTTASRSATLIDIAWPETAGWRVLRFLALAVAGSLLLTISAKITVPFWPVQMSLQTFAVMAIAAAFGWRLAVATVLVYLAQGAAGLPVFQGTPEKGIGLLYMMGPTGGYLVGFIACAAIVGHAAETWARGSILKLGAAMLIGDAVVFALGMLWLGTLLGWDKPILQWGLTPFLLGDLVKIALAAVAVPTAISALERLRGL